MNKTLQQFHFFNGHAAQFWPEFTSFCTRYLQAESCFLFNRKGDQWTLLLEQTTPNKAQLSKGDLNRLTQVAQQCDEHGQFVMEAHHHNSLLIGQALPEEAAPCSKVMVFQFNSLDQRDIDATLKQLSLLSDTPLIYQKSQQSALSQIRCNDFAQILDFLHLLNQQDHFLAAAMLTVNETVSRYHCDRISLGWVKKGYVQLQSISHMERFEAKMERVGQLEAAMEEAFDQDEEVISPALESQGPINRDHQHYAQTQQISQIVSLPLRIGQQIVGILTCERNTRPFSSTELRSLRILCDQMAPRLVMLHDNDRWIGAQITTRMKKATTALVGVEHSLVKVSALLLCALLIISCVVKLPYRVEAPFILRSKDVRQITAPFDGFIDSIDTEVGQHVVTGQTLLQLDNRELTLQETAALANQVRYEREMDQARARNALIEMKIAAAQAQQARAQLEMIQLQLRQTQLRAPFNGVIVEGNFMEKRGAPVDKGVVLLTIAAGQRLFAEIALPEESLQDLQPGLDGEFTFISRPKEKYPFILEQIAPMATSGESGNSFTARSNELLKSQSWWRPGMSGVAKVNAGQRTAIWIIGHKTVRFLRLLAWW